MASILEIKQFPIRVKLNSNFQLDESFDCGTILQLNSVRLEFEGSVDNSYEVSVTALGSDLEYNKSIAIRNWKNVNTNQFELDIFEFHKDVMKSNRDFQTSIFVMEDDDCFDIIDDEPKFSINDMLNVIKAIAPTLQLINKDNVETFVEELRSK
jgi:hypothetical protein